MSSRAHEKCKVDGCPGVAEICTDGNGGTVVTCPCCERRRSWEKKYLPPKPPIACQLCGGTTPDTPKGGGMRKKFCPACRVLYSRYQSRSRKTKAARKTIALVGAA